ncbi:MAG: hypothetical protein QGH20_03820, partial [Candidatus Latescibacteria bacterium]|nr:hypothetical protein [Candidatus Latescibacterota bacterium]
MPQIIVPHQCSRVNDEAGVEVVVGILTGLPWLLVLSKHTRANTSDLERLFYEGYLFLTIVLV